MMPFIVYDDEPQTPTRRQGRPLSERIGEAIGDIFEKLAGGRECNAVRYVPTEYGLRPVYMDGGTVFNKR